MIMMELVSSNKVGCEGKGVLKIRQSWGKLSKLKICNSITITVVTKKSKQCTFYTNCNLTSDNLYPLVLLSASAIEVTEGCSYLRNLIIIIDVVGCYLILWRGHYFRDVPN